MIKRSPFMIRGVILLLVLLVPLQGIHAAVFPADPDTPQQWYLNKIDAYNAWGYSKGSRAITVAVIDTGVDIDNPDLTNNLWTNPGETLDGRDNDGNGYIDDVSGWDFVDGDNDPRPDLKNPKAKPQAIHHGTLVSGIIGGVGNNGIGIAGLNWNIKIMPLRALDSEGNGDVANVEEAVRYAMDKRVDIINLSFVGPGFSRSLFMTLREAYARGIMVVAAVGNEALTGLNLDQTPLYPVCYSGQNVEDIVFGVTATDQNDRRGSFANYGANCVDLSAPGVSIFSTQFFRPDLGYDKIVGDGWAGTSLAAPMVSGVAALIKAINPSYRVPEIRSILLASADPIDALNPGFEGKLGKGRLNARRALELAANGTIAPVTAAGSLGIPYLLVAPRTDASGEVKMTRMDGSVVQSLRPYGVGFRGGITVTSGDVNGDGRAEIITGAGPGGGPHVRIFGTDGTAAGQFFAYAKSFRGGITVTSGDVNGDGRAEIITGAGPGGGPHVRIFGADGSVVGGFFAYESSYRGGIKVLAADLDGDGRAEILTTPMSGSPRVKIFDSHGKEVRSFLAFPKSVVGGVNLAVGDVDGDGVADIVVAPNKGVSPEVRVYNTAGQWQRAFQVLNDRFLGGIDVVVADLDGDGRAEIITGAGPGGGPHVQVFDGFGKLKDQFFAYDKNFRGGLNVGSIRL